MIDIAFCKSIRMHNFFFCGFDYNCDLYRLSTSELIFGQEGLEYFKLGKNEYIIQSMSDFDLIKEGF